MTVGDCCFGGVSALDRPLGLPNNMSSRVVPAVTAADEGGKVVVPAGGGGGEVGSGGIMPAVAEEEEAEVPGIVPFRLIVDTFGPSWDWEAS